MKINTERAIEIIVVVVILFALYGALIPIAQDSGDQLNNSNICLADGCYYNYTNSACNTNSTNSVICNKGISLSELFSSNGIIITFLMISLLLIIIKSIKKNK